MPAPAPASLKLSPSDQKKLKELVERFIQNGHSLKGLSGLNDKTMETTYSLAFNHYNGGKFDEAAKLFQFLCVFDPYKPKYWMGLAASRQMLKEYEAAITAYSMAGILKMDDPKPALYAADCYLVMGKKELATKALTAAAHWAGRKEEYKDIHHRATSLLSLLEGKNVKAPATPAEKN